MKLDTKPGKYILAVSGGVDSMVLLDLLAKKPGIKIVVAHFDHGIRPNSAKDKKFVAETADRLGLAFEPGLGQLGKRASEETARKARYDFLNRAKSKYNAMAVITAHHQDDLIETAFLNLLRGTGSKGLIAIMANKTVLRPMLGYRKKQIIRYAKVHGLKWREDLTNSDNNYLRNHIRNLVLPNLTARQRREILLNIEKVANTEKFINPLIAKISHSVYKDSLIDRSRFASLPINVGNELITYWLRDEELLDYNRKTIYRLNAALRSSKPGTTRPIKNGLSLKIGAETAQFSYTL